MLPQLSAAGAVFLRTEPTDMRKSFDGLFGMVREFLGQDPLSGHLFLFRQPPPRPREDPSLGSRDSLVIWYKRLEAGTFQSLDPHGDAPQSGTAGLELSVTDLRIILGGFDLSTVDNANATHACEDLP